jgi:hypothetical protein
MVVQGAIMKRRHDKGDVQWTLPGKTKPFAWSTTATSDLIAVLYEELGDLQAVYNAINYDEDAKKIVGYYLYKGFRQANIRY